MDIRSKIYTIPQKKTNTRMANYLTWSIEPRSEKFRLGGSDYDTICYSRQLLKLYFVHFLPFWIKIPKIAKHFVHHRINKRNRSAHKAHQTHSSKSTFFLFGFICKLKSLTIIHFGS